MTENFSLQIDYYNIVSTVSAVPGPGRCTAAPCTAFTLCLGPAFIFSFPILICEGIWSNKQHQNPQMQGERFEVKLKLKLMNKMLKLPFIKTPKSLCIYLCKCKKRQVNVNSCLSRHNTISYVIWYDSFNALFIFHIPAVSTPSSHHKITPLPFINNGFVGICNK